MDISVWVRRCPERISGNPDIVHPRKLILWTFPGLLCLCCLRLSAQSPDDATLQHYSAAAQKAIAAGHYDEAEQSYRKLLQLKPDLTEIHVTLGAIYFQERKYEQAASELGTALKLRPGLSKAGPLLAMSLSELGRYQEALPGLEKGFHQSTDPAIKRMCGLQLIRTYTGLQQNEKAVETALELNRMYPGDAEVLYHTGKTYGSLAFLTMQRLAQVAPESLWRHLATGEAYESQGTWDAALDEYRRVLALDPKRPGVHYRIGRTLLARSRPQDTDDALAEFSHELELNPANANAAYEIAEIHRRFGRLDEAHRFFERALKYYPDFEEAQLGLAATLISMDKPDLALPHLRKTIALNPNDEVAWYRLSRAEHALGHSDEQQKALAQFQQLESRDAGQPQTPASLFSPSDVTKQQIDTNTPQPSGPQ